MPSWIHADRLRLYNISRDALHCLPKKHTAMFPTAGAETQSGGDTGAADEESVNTSAGSDGAVSGDVCEQGSAVLLQQSSSIAADEPRQPQQQQLSQAQVTPASQVLDRYELGDLPDTLESEWHEIKDVLSHR